MFKNVLIPVDVSVPDETQKLLKATKELVADWSCDLHIATVIPNMGMAIVGSYFDKGFEGEARKAAKTQLAADVEASGLTASQAVLMGKVYDNILSHANDIGADLIIVGAHQPELGDYLLGANAARIVRHSKQSVLVIRS